MVWFGLYFQHTVSFVIMSPLFVDTPYACSREQWAVCMSSIINSKLAAVPAAAAVWVREDDLSTNLGLEWMPFVSQLLRWCFDCGATMLGRTHISADNHFNLGTIFDLGCCWYQSPSIKVLQRGLGYSAVGSSMWYILKKISTRKLKTVQPAQTNHNLRLFFIYSIN